MLPGLECARLYSAASASERVGGDFYDAFDLGRGKIALTVGDVSGKGLDAAALTALVRNALRSYAIGGLSPGAALLMGNEVVHRFTDPETFVTLFFGILDTERRVLTYSSAGHPPPIVVGGACFVSAHSRFAGCSARSRTPALPRASSASVPTTRSCFTRTGSPRLETGGPACTERSGCAGESRSCAAKARTACLHSIFEDARHFAHGELHDDIALVAVRVMAADRDRAERRRPAPVLCQADRAAA